MNKERLVEQLKLSLESFLDTNKYNTKTLSENMANEIVVALSYKGEIK